MGQLRRWIAGSESASPELGVLTRTSEAGAAGSALLRVLSRPPPVRSLPPWPFPAWWPPRPNLVTSRRPVLLRVPTSPASLYHGDLFGRNK